MKEGLPRHCERSEAIHRTAEKNGLLRRDAPRKDGGRFAAVRSAPAHRRHQYFVAAAGAAIDFLAGAELQILAHADPHFAEPGLVAGHGDRLGSEAWIDLDEG